MKIGPSATKLNQIHLVYDTIGPTLDVSKGTNKDLDIVPEKPKGPILNSLYFYYFHESKYLPSLTKLFKSLDVEDISLIFTFISLEPFVLLNF